MYRHDCHNLAIPFRSPFRDGEFRSFFNFKFKGRDGDGRVFNL